MHHIKVPTELTLAPFNQRELKLNGFSVIESCSHTVNSRGSMFLEDHMLLYVKQGSNTLRDGKMEYAVHKKEMVFLRRATLVEYHKAGDETQDDLYVSLMFFFKDEFLQEFIKMANIKTIRTEEKVRILVKPVNERLMRYFESIEGYFNESAKIDTGLVKIKMLELLYDISGTDKNLLQQLLQMKKPARTEIPAVMESNYMNPISLSELAYLSGRSLASFKRDFQAIYNIPPSVWVRNKRLAKALEMLEHTSMTVSDVCYSLGFGNPAHFSRIFKDHFGYPPSTIK